MGLFSSIKEWLAPHKVEEAKVVEVCEPPQALVEKVEIETVLTIQPEPVVVTPVFVPPVDTQKSFVFETKAKEPAIAPAKEPEPQAKLAVVAKAKPVKVVKDEAWPFPATRPVEAKAKPAVKSKPRKATAATSKKK
jgi:hypothetical protein